MGAGEELEGTECEGEELGACEEEKWEGVVEVDSVVCGRRVVMRKTPQILCFGVLILLRLGLKDLEEIFLGKGA